MQTVKVKRAELLGILRGNREEHRGNFLKAQAGFKKAVEEALEEMLDDARKGKRIQLTVNLPVPVDQTKEYDRAIRMLEMSVDEVLELTTQEFATYVMDDWSWKAGVTATNSRYL